MIVAPPIVRDLVERFERNLMSYHSSGYNETQLRREFIDPLFDEALGWDISNRAGLADAYKDVVHEDAIKIGRAHKAPDYGFRIGGVRKFFLEAKKPRVNIKEDKTSAYQLRRYAWSSKLPLSILTNFQEFAVYEGRIRPKPTDKASVGRVMDFTFDQYVENWDRIAEVFAKDAVLKGSFDKYAESAKRKRGTSEVDQEFLKEIEGWRDSLARNIALRNTDLSVRELNFAVQRTVDRIIFLRMCEDRGIEKYGQLRDLLDGEDVYRRLFGVFEAADEKYNSGLFHFRKEKDRVEAPDELTPGITIDDKVFKGIMRGLYYPESPYEFSILPADILGSVYEQFLGKLIRLTPAHRAKVEEKPEVKKAGGVYYTPTYIVDYIVENTVGNVIKGKSPKQIENLRILDPACGSGSFLVAAYTYLLEHHLHWYVSKGPEKHSKKLYQGPGDQSYLTTREKKRILLNNIFGVDIDSQAVEVTKLNLLLKVLENESQDTLERQQKLWRERALPDLAENVKCGNSLIGSDFYDTRQMTLFDDDERHRINVFDWHEEFSTIIKEGGFDVVIGNPPYIPMETMSRDEKAYHQVRFPHLERKYDSSVVFILAMLDLLRRGGRLGFISSVTWQTGENYRKLREYLFTQAGVLRLVNLPFDVFKRAYVDTGVYILTNRPARTYHLHRFPKKERLPDLSNIEYKVIPRKLVSPPDYKIVLEPTAQAILERVLDSQQFTPLGEFTVSTQGLAGSRFRKSMEPRGDDWYPFLQKGQVYRYVLRLDEIVYTDIGEHPSLRRFYEANPKLLIRRIVNRQDRLMVGYTDRKLVFKKDINPFVITDSSWDPLFVLAVLNSLLVSYLYVNTSSIATKDDFRQTTLAELRRIPVPKVSTDDRHARAISDLAARLLALTRDLSEARTDHDKKVIERQIFAADKHIDRMVFELYGLTDKEIAIIEKA